MSSGNVSITNIVIAKVNMLHGDSLETRPPCFSLHATFNCVNERIVTSACWNNTAVGISRISKVSLSLPKHQVFVEHVCDTCRPLLLYLRRKFQGNVFVIASVYHKNEIINVGPYSSPSSSPSSSPPPPPPPTPSPGTLMNWGSKLIKSPPLYITTCH